MTGVRRRASDAEAEIRAATVAHLRQELPPTTRLVHELPIGGARADIAAVLCDRLIVFELKSEKDTLKRLPEQIRHFQRVTSDIIVVAHRKHFDAKPYANGQPRLAWPDMRGNFGVWVYPFGDDLPRIAQSLYAWRFRRSVFGPLEPRQSAWAMLDLLWAAELRIICADFGLNVSRRATRPQMMDQIVWNRPARDIWPAVCRALRARPFAEADPPIVEHGEAA